VDATILSLTGTAEKELPSTFRKHFFATIPRQRCFPFRGGLGRARISDWRGIEMRRTRYENHDCKCRCHDRRLSLLSAVPSAKAQSGKGMNSLVPLELLGGIGFSHRMARLLLRELDGLDHPSSFPTLPHQHRMVRVEHFSVLHDGIRSAYSLNNPL
jgi:hypothetical protein